jgi:hypothetical protein
MPHGLVDLQPEAEQGSYTMRKLTFKVDELDYQAIRDALAMKQVRLHGVGGPPKGQGDLAGRLLADIARDYVLPSTRIA